MTADTSASPTISTSSSGSTTTTSTRTFNDDAPVLYINLLVNDCSKAVHKKVKQTVTNKLPSPLQKHTNIADSAAKLASWKVKPSTVAAQMGPELCQMIPQKMLMKGIDVIMEPVFVHENYIVLQFQVQNVDTVKMEQTLREENADLTLNDTAADERGIITWVVEWGLYLMGPSYQQTLQTQVLPAKIQRGMEEKIKHVMDTKLSQQGVQADVTVLPETHQSRFFFQTVKEVQQQQQQQQQRANPTFNDDCDSSDISSNEDHECGKNGDSDGGECCIRSSSEDSQRRPRIVPLRLLRRNKKRDGFD